MDARAMPTRWRHRWALRRAGATARPVRLARTIGIPLRYFVAKMYHGPFLVVAIAWIRSSRGAASSGSPGSSSPPTRAWFPPTTSSSSIRSDAPIRRRAIGASSIRRCARVGGSRRGRRRLHRRRPSTLKQWIAGVPDGEPIAVAFSGGIDSTAVLLLRRHACAGARSDPDRIRAFTLDFGGGEDAAQAERAVASSV